MGMEDLEILAWIHVTFFKDTYRPKQSTLCCNPPALEPRSLQCRRSKALQPDNSSSIMAQSALTSSPHLHPAYVAVFVLRLRAQLTVLKNLSIPARLVPPVTITPIQGSNGLFAHPGPPVCPPFNLITGVSQLVKGNSDIVVWAPSLYVWNIQFDGSVRR
jgi:hypothetical protein